MNTRSVDPISSTSAAPEPSVTTRPSKKRRSVFLEEVIKNKGRLKSDRNKPLPKPPKRPKSRNEKIFYGVGAVLMMLGLMTIFWQNWGQDFVRSRSTDPNVKPVAKVDGSYITQKQLTDATGDKSKLNTALYGDKVAAADLNEESYNDLVLERALQQEAAKRKITINDGDVDAQIKKAHQERAKLMSFAEKSGVGEATALRTYRIQAYQDKLAKYLLDTRDVRQYAVRWDYGPTGTDIVDKGAEFEAFQITAKEKLRQVVETPLRDGKKYEDFKSTINLNLDEESNEYRPMDVLTRTIFGMNRKGNKAFQDGEQDWGAIEKLNTVGQYSALIRSDGGYFAIYQLVGRNTGPYVSWDDYANAVRRGAKKFVQADYTKSIIATDYEKKVCRREADGIFERVLSFVGVGTANAIACNSNHWNIFHGNLKDQYGVIPAVSNPKVHIEQRVPDGSSLCGGYSTADVTTDGVGNWNAGDHWSCFTRWRAVYSADGCDTITKDIKNPGTNNGDIDAGPVVINCGVTTNHKPVVALNVNCDTDTIDGYAYDVDNTSGGFGFDVNQTAVGVMYSGNPYAPVNPFALPGGVQPSEDCPGVACRFVAGPGVGDMTIPGSFNPGFYANQSGFSPLSDGRNHHFNRSGLLAFTSGTPKRNLQDGNTYGYLAIALDIGTNLWEPGDAQSWTTCKHDINYDVVGDKAYDGAAPPTSQMNELKAGLVWANKPAQSTSSLQAGSDTSWQLSSLNRTATNVISADKATNWEPYAYTICLDGNAACHATATKVLGTSVTLDANFFQQDAPSPHIRWYYRQNVFSIVGNTASSTTTTTDTTYRNGIQRYSGGGIPLSANINSQPSGSFSFNNVAYNPASTTDLNIIADKPGISTINWNVTSATFCIDTGGGCVQADATEITSGTSKYFTINPQTIPGGSTIRVTWYYSVTDTYLYYDKMEPYSAYGANTYLSGKTDVGRILVDSTVVCKHKGEVGAAPQTCNYGTYKAMPYGKDYSVKAEAVPGYDVRGYAYCTGAVLCSTGTFDEVNANTGDPADNNGKIVVNSTNAATVTVDVTYANGAISVNGKNVGAAGAIGIRFYYKPKPVTIQARGVIDMSGPTPASNNDVNPCIASDYKKSICDNVQVRAIRMNTANENGDPLNGLGCNLSNDLVPKLPGYDYKFHKNYYCASDGEVSGATPWIHFGKSWDATNQAAGEQTNPSTPVENTNAAYFRNLYPGNYKLQYKLGTVPSLGGEDAYTVQTKNCPVNNSNCSSTLGPVAMKGGCFLNHRQQWYRNTPAFTDATLCTNNLGNSPDDLPAASSILQCASNYLSYHPGGLGCAYYKTNLPNNSEFLTVQPANNAYGEATFFFTPKIKVSNPVLTCDTYEADVVYMPDPSRQVTSTIQVGAEVTNPADPSKLAEYPPTSGTHLKIEIPKWVGNTMVKDGKGLRFNHFVYFDDPALSPPPGGINGGATPGYKYTRQNAFTGVHACKNNAICDQAYLQSQADTFGEMDASNRYSFKVKITNTGQSFWQNNYTDNYMGVTHPGSALITNHKLAILATNGQTPSYLGGTTPPDSALYGSVATGGLTLANNTESDPDPLNPSNVQTFTILITPPTNGAANYQLEIGMEGDAWNGNTTTIGQFLERFPTAGPPSGKCVVNFEVRNNYHPWLRVQNGGVGALGQAKDQPEGSRGTYKQLNTNASPPGSVGQVPPVADINVFAQYTVMSAATDNYFCSSNGYLYGRDQTSPYTTSFYANKKCDFGVSEYNLDPSLKANLTPPGTGDLIYKTAADSLANRNLCADDGATSTTNGPADSSSPSGYYRSVGNAAALTDFDALSASPLVISLVRPTKTIAGSLVMDRPCPTIRNWTNNNLPAMQIGRGRGTILHSGDLHITGDITNVLSNTYLGVSGVPGATGDINIKPGGATNPYDLAQLNRLPNLGIIVDGDVIIDQSVGRIDASIYASGQIFTCDAYPGTTVGAKPSYKDATTPNALGAKAPMLADNPDAAKCNKQLKINGTMASAKSFSFGRNYLDFAGIVNRFNNSVNNIFVPLGKFCTSFTTDPVYTPKPARCGNPTYAGLANAPDFDNLNMIDPTTGQSFSARQGAIQSLYYGKPAEDVTYNGLMMIAPPPGFENVSDNALNRAQFDRRAFPPLF